jgi:hypothetical protein
MYYLGTEDAFALVRTFNHKPAQFDHQKLIQRLENLTGAPTVGRYVFFGSSMTLCRRASSRSPSSSFFSCWVVSWSVQHDS